MINSFVKLPRINTIEINNYGLFNNNWKYNVKNGLNLFIGANGLGKTTTANLIIFGLIGFIEELKEDLNIDYFKNRGGLVQNDSLPTIKLEFSIEDNEIIILRNIYNVKDNILELLVNDEKHTKDEADNLEYLYERYLKEFTGINDFSDIYFLFKYFLIREEEGNYLFWDNKGADQSKLIRLLINQAGFDEEYNKLEEDYRRADSSIRDRQYLASQLRERLNEFDNLREDELKKVKAHLTKKDLEQKLNELITDENALKQKHTQNLDNINYLRSIILDNQSKIEEYSARLENITDQVSTLEKKLYSYIYSDEKVLSAIHKLKHYNSCIFCGNKPNPTIIKNIVECFEIKAKCPVCESNLSMNNIEKVDNKEIISKLDKYNNEIEELKQKIDELENRKIQNQNQLNEVWILQNDNERLLNSKSIDILDLKIKISNLTGQPDEQITIYDKEIQSINNQINKIYKEIEPDKKKTDKLKKHLDDKNDEQNKTINKFHEDLNEIFKKYSSKYFPYNCDLVIDEKTPTKSKVRISTFVPQFNDKKRKYQRDCSTSQRLFLEYIFRLSLIELYNIITNNNAILIMETSEGAFDITNTKQVAGIFNEFSKTGLPIIIIANFSKPDFLNELAKGIYHEKIRVLNYMEFGKISEQAKEDKSTYDKIITDLKLK